MGRSLGVVAVSETFDGYEKPIAAGEVPFQGSLFSVTDYRQR